MNKLENIDFDKYAEIGSKESQHIVKLTEFASLIEDRLTQGVESFGDELTVEQFITTL